MALADTLRDFGAEVEALCAFDQDSPRLLPYASMLAARGRGNSDLSLIEGVYEWQNEPLAFLVDGTRLKNDELRLDRLRRLVAMRGDAPYLAVFVPGSIDVYRVTLDAAASSQARVDLNLPPNEKVSTFAYLGNKRPGIVPGQQQWISQVILNLLSSSIDRLKKTGVDDEDAISLVGRALFTRFLADRYLIPKSVAATDLEAARLFDTAAKAQTTSAWLDRTFNGDFLPLARRVFRSLPTSGYHVLGDMLRKAHEGQLLLGWEQRWDNLDFAHIPVGVLSQAYEHYLRQHAPRQQRKEGGYYTPRAIADLMVRGAFAAAGVDDAVHDTRVLDPAAGAGVFLLTVFRELVAARWRHDGKRPETKALREILYRQIVGFDINEAALRFAALGLYLMSIELDPHPEPIRKLRFKNLRGTVLFKVSRSRTDKLGSLGPAVGPEHNGKYDLVVGNPPWSSGTGLPSWSFVENTVKSIAAKRLPADWGAPPLPNEGLDLPFVWRAMEWAKQGGQIAFALHGRLLVQQGDGMREARRALFAALDVSAVLNGSELRQTKVWPEVSAPFCLLYGCNRMPPPGSAFRFVTPRVETALNDSGTMRVDAQSAGFVTSTEVIEQPQILKILARGGDADLEVFRAIRGAGLLSLRECWIKEFGKARGRPRFSGNGYQRLRPSSRTRKDGDGLPGVDASYLRGMPEVTGDSVKDLLIDESTLREFDEARIHDPRQVELFRGPLLILHKSPPAGNSRIQMTVSDHDVVFNETYYGYSASTHPDGASLVRYLALILSSQVVMWLSLILSGEFGFEREVIEKATIDEFLIPSFALLAPEDRERSRILFSQVATGGSVEAWREVNEWVAKLYGLSKRDLQVIADTLEYSLPFAENRRKAQTRVSNAEIERFRESLVAELSPWANRFGREITIVNEQEPSLSPWQFLRLTTHESRSVTTSGKGDWTKFIGLADELAATELIVEDGSLDSLWIARLAQARYWSVTAARRVAQRVIWEHVRWLSGRSAA